MLFLGAKGDTLAPFFIPFNMTKREDIAEIILKSIWIDKEIEQPIPLVTIQGKVILTDSNFMTISGLPKARKTTVMQFFLSSAITGKEIYGIKVNLAKEDKFVLIDTEQSIYDFYKQNKFLKKLNGKSTLPKNFSAYLFREYEPDIILNSIYQIAETLSPKIIFIDNLTQLARNPNNPEESHKIVQMLKTITAKFNIAIVCLLHLSKSNSFTLGHLGSETDRGAQSVLKVTLDKETDISTLDCTMLRSDRHFTPLSIQYDDNKGVYAQVDFIPAEEQAKKRKFNMNNFLDVDIFNKVALCFEDAKQQVYSEVIESLKENFGVGTNIAKQQILPHLKHYKFIKEKNKFYTIDKTIHKF